MKKIKIIFFITFCFFKIAAAQNSVMTPADYVAQFKEIAMREEKRMGIPAAISLAQGILETECGNSELVKKSNNHFGIKCKGTWTAGSVAHDDDAPGECFRVYKTADDSYRDHSNFLRGNDRYSFLFKFDPRDYKAWAYGLKKAGYATNPRYPDILIKNIEDNNLEQYTLLAMNEMPHFDASKYASDPEDKDADNTIKSTADKDDANLTAPLKLTINGCNALMVPRGTSLLAVATQNNINLNRLLEMNDMKQDGLLDKDQYIFLEKKKKEGNTDYYITLSGETLFDVAQKNGVLLQSLCDYNNLNSADNVSAGTKLLLRPGAKKSIPATQYIPSKNEITDPPEKAPPDRTIHIVAAKESLYSISKKYNISIDELKDWNNLKDNNLKVGQMLIVSK